MGVLYSVLPLDAENAEWLASEGIDHPSPFSPARLPTPCELAAVLGQLKRYTSSIAADLATGRWDAQIDTSIAPENQPWAFLCVREYHSDDEPHDFYFSKAWPEVVFAVVERLAHVVGPLIVLDDSACVPVVVRAGDSVERLVQQYHSV